MSPATTVNVTLHGLGEVRGSTAKRWLWWGLAVVGIVAAFVLGWIFLRKTPTKAVTTVIDAVREHVDAIDAQARVDTAIAIGVEQKQIEKVEAAAKIKDPAARAQAFADLAKEDY